jgi:hypothetical protein
MDRVMDRSDGPISVYWRVLGGGQGYLMVEDRTIYRDLAHDAAALRPAYPGAGPRTAAAREGCPWRALVVVAPVRLGMQVGGLGGETERERVKEMGWTWVWKIGRAKGRG